MAKIRVYRTVSVGPWNPGWVRTEWRARQGASWFPFYIGGTWQGAMDAAWRRIRRDA